MAFVSGRQSTISVDGTDISAYVGDWSLTYDSDTAETTTIGSANDTKTYVAGMKGWSVTCSGYWDATGDGVLEGTFDGATVAFSGSPDGGTTTYTGNMLVTSYSQSASAQGLISWDANFQGSGTLTRT